MKFVKLTFLVFFGLIVLGHAQPETGSTDILPIDVANMDQTVSPGVDFFRYVNGGWLAKNPVPPGYSRWGSFSEVEERNEAILQDILTTAIDDPNPVPGSNTQKLGDFYYTALDVEGRDKMGIEPLKPDLNKIEQISSPADLQNVMVSFLTRRLRLPFFVWVGQDDKNSSIFVPQVFQSGLGLPDRDYYLDEGEKYKNIRTEYVKHIQKLFELTGYSPEQARDMANVVMTMETRLAGASMTRLERRDPEKTYNKMTLDELQALTPDFDWKNFFREAGFNMDRDFENGVIIGQPDFLKEVNKMMKDVSLDDWRTYMQYKLIASTADKLSSDLEKEVFHFYSTVLRGIDEMKPLWKRALDDTEGSLGEIMGQEFVKRSFSPAAKERVLEMVNNIKEVLSKRINELEWMSDATKQEAQKKLAAFKPKIGYPDKWRDYSKLEVDRSSLFNNSMRASVFYFNRNKDRIGKPVEDEWFMNPQTVNASYNASRNEIVFPAGILQPPFFSENFDDAINYGGIGTVIGHEITHGFDDQGRKYDWEGNLRDWWTEEDAQKYTQRADKLANQYSSYVVIDDVHLEGKLTLGENIADLGGLKLAYLAFMNTEEAKTIEMLDGFTPQQRFFISWAQIWRQNITDQELRLRINTDPHSPGLYRAIVPPSNMEAFFDVFNIKPGDPMYREESERVVIG